jgi:hypothetical protein
MAVVTLECGTDDQVILETLREVDVMLTPIQLARKLGWQTVSLPDTGRVQRALDRLMKQELVDQSTVYYEACVEIKEY